MRFNLPDPGHEVTRIRVAGPCEHPYEDDEPSGYVGWHEWAKKHEKTHKHTQCPKCGLSTICRPRTARTKTS